MSFNWKDKSEDFEHHDFLYEYIEENQVCSVLEIGVFNGNNAKNMIKLINRNTTCEEARYYGFDTFDGSFNNRLDEVREKIGKLNCEFELIPGDSRETLPNKVEELHQMDLIFIDGGHAYPVAKSDWEHCKKLMGEETAVFFHNYDYSGVKKVVDNIPQSKFAVEILDPPSESRTARVSRRNCNC